MAFIKSTQKPKPLLPRSFARPQDRWASLGPYYAMFPVGFAEQVIAKYARPGQSVLDPFAGRGANLLFAAANGCTACGFEINPVAWVYSKTKLCPAPLEELVARMELVLRKSAAFRPSFPSEFFSLCFSGKVFRFLSYCREALNWTNDATDRTLMAFLLAYLHGKRGQALSNQMSQNKAMAPGYSVAWWKHRGLVPPEIDLYEFLHARFLWRYAKGKPCYADGFINLGDCTTDFASLESALSSGRLAPISLVFTSPPYCGLTNYHLDQWLRLWLLGGSPNPQVVAGVSTRKFVGLEQYSSMLTVAFTNIARVVTPKTVIFVRTGRDSKTLLSTKKALEAAFPERAFKHRSAGVAKQSLTAVVGNNARGEGEVDFLSLPRIQS